MTHKKNVFSYIMWAVFACITAALYYTSFSTYLEGLAILDNDYNSIIVVLVGVIIIELVIIISYFIRKGAIGKDDSGYGMWSYVGFIIAGLFCLVTRILIVGAGNASSIGDSVIPINLTDALIGSSGRVYTDFSTIDKMFLSVCSTFFKIFGNCGWGIYGAQFAISIVTFLLLFFGIRRLYGGMEAFTVCLGYGVLPLFYDNVTVPDDSLLLIAMFAACIYVLSWLVVTMRIKAVGVIMIIVSAAFTGICALYSSTVISIVPLALVLIIEAKDIKAWIKSVYCLIYIVIASLFFLFDCIYEGFASFRPNTIPDIIVRFAQYRFCRELSASSLFEYARENYVLILAILCITYVVMFLRCRYDDAHSMILLFIISVIASCVFGGSEDAAYNMIATLSLLIIGGAGIKKICLAGWHREIEEDSFVADESADEIGQTDWEELSAELSDDDSDIVTDTVSDDNINDESDKNTQETEAGAVSFVACDTPVDVADTRDDGAVEYLINPLPVPKKHEKKTMDYEHEIDPSMMHYDYEPDGEKSEYDV